MVANRLHLISEYYFSHKLRTIEALQFQGIDVINFGIGSPDMDPHPSVLQALQQASVQPAVHGYQSYNGSSALREAFAAWYARWYHVELDAGSEILPLMGSKEGIMHICMTYLNPGDRVLIPNPGYLTYSSVVKIAGGTPVDYHLHAENNWFPDLAALESSDLSDVKMMFINYPHMPSGAKGNFKMFEQLVAFARRKNILLVHDNPYGFILNEEKISLLVVPGAKEVSLELNSLSKSHNMAGWRVGVLCGASQRIAEILRFKSNMDSGMFLPLQSAAVKALSLGKEWFSDLNAVYFKRRNLMYQLLDRLSCSYIPDQSGLFLWAKVPETFKDGYDFSGHLLDHYGIFVTPGGVFGSEGNSYIRLSLCCSEERIKEATGRLIRNHASSTNCLKELTS